MERRDIGLGLALVTLLCATNALAQTAANPLLAIDQHRTTVVERVVGEWGDRLSLSGAGLNREQLREMLNGLRADQLLAASLAGSPTGLRDVLAHSLAGAMNFAPRLAQAKALGDSAADVVYTPVTPCRLVETRTAFAAVYQGGGAFGAGEIRNYTAAGGNGVCLTQLPPGLNPSALQLQVFGIPNNGVSGDIEVLPQGATFGSTATLVFVNNVPISSASTTARVNLANNQIGVQVRIGSAHVAIDLVGYFKRPGNYGGTHTITGTYATDSGGFNNAASGSYSTVAGGTFNFATGVGATVPGGADNVAGGAVSFAAGNRAKAGADGVFVWADSLNFDVGIFTPNFFAVRATGGVGFTVGIDGSGAATWYCNLSNGVFGWQCVSDRDAKENFIQADGVAILDQLAAMPLYSWNAKNVDPRDRHLGPTAQDFRAAFGYGNDDKTISTGDMNGVALAAIQGLNAKLEERVAEQQRENVELRRMLMDLRSAMEVKAAMR